MQNIGDIQKWAAMEPGVDYGFHKRARPMTLEFNTSEKVQIFIEFKDEEPRLLATVDGRDTVKVVVPDKEFVIGHTTDGAHVFMMTGDGEFHFREDMGEVKFTKIHEGRRLSPDQQEIYDKLNRNFMRNQRMLMDELERVADDRNRYASAASASAQVQEQAPVAVPPVGTVAVPASDPIGSVEGGHEGSPS